jgi:hypothetical protein
MNLSTLQMRFQMPIINIVRDARFNILFFAKLLLERRLPILPNYAHSTHPLPSFYREKLQGNV